MLWSLFVCGKTNCMTSCCVSGWEHKRIYKDIVRHSTGKHFMWFLCTFFSLSNSESSLVTWWEKKTHDEPKREKDEFFNEKKRFETFVQSIKFFLVAVVVVVVVESLSPKNLNVNSFSLKEFCKLRSKHPINFNFFFARSLSLSLCDLFRWCNKNVRCHCSNSGKQWRVWMNLLSFWQMELNQIVGEKHKTKRLFFFFR